MKNLIIFLLLSFFLFGCIGTPEQEVPLNETPNEEVNVTPPIVQKVNPTIRFIDYPLELNANEGARFIVEVKDAENVNDDVFVYIWKDSVNPVKYPTDYVYSSTSVNQLSTKNNQYETYIVIDTPGKYYARALVIAEGQYYWSEEAMFNVLTTDGKTMKTYNIEIGYDSLTPPNIDVNKGEIIVITFTASPSTHPNGVRILSPGWKDSPSLKPGQSFKAEFTADTSFSYRMYWLAGNLLKSTGTITVN